MSSNILASPLWICWCGCATTDTTGNPVMGWGGRSRWSGWRSHLKPQECASQSKGIWFQGKHPLPADHPLSSPLLFGNTRLYEHSAKLVSPWLRQWWAEDVHRQPTWTWQHNHNQAALSRGKASLTIWSTLAIFSPKELFSLAAELLVPARG